MIYIPTYVQDHICFPEHRLAMDKPSRFPFLIPLLGKRTAVPPTDDAAGLPMQISNTVSIALLITSHDVYVSPTNPMAMAQFPTTLIKGPSPGFSTTGPELSNSNTACRQSAVLGLLRLASQVLFRFVVEVSGAVKEGE